MFLPRLHLTFGGAGNRRYGYLIFFLPSLIFWTADVSKEGIMLFLIGRADLRLCEGPGPSGRLCVPGF